MDLRLRSCLLVGFWRPVVGFRFSPANPDCWHRGSQQLCCAEPSPAECWDDFWNHARCCRDHIELQEVADSDCMGPIKTLEEQMLPEPNEERPFVFLWDEKTGGTTFNDWLLASSARLKRLNATHISDFGWPNVIGTPFFLKTYEQSKLESLQILSATVDWNIFSAIGCRVPKRLPSCFLLLRNPVDRFLSYYLERSDRRLEGGSIPLRLLTKFSLSEFEDYLDSVAWFDLTACASVAKRQVSFATPKTLSCAWLMGSSQGPLKAGEELSSCTALVGGCGVMVVHELVAVVNGY
eukprot:Skav218500  [mRNA]  locus=scaffold3758:82291:84233:+ [translate_table: standard]